ncbi:MAG: DUF975 family protein [Candidatus Cloacimonetes bacterium]|nr:DUF975 family protein [Candidatus Cloacimonadota bacterium]MDY0367261.1 DUF975 family protein [Candidatus Syntrophosphaera sp.]
MNNEEIRREAREFLKDKWLNLALVWLIFGAVLSLVPATLGIGGIVALIVGGPLMLGISRIFLKLWHRQDFQIEEMFQGFNDFSRSLVAYLLMCLYVFLWSLLLVVPGIIAAISYSMTFFIMAEDPKIEAQEALRKSKEMMEGHKSEYFSLLFSFIGWFLLACLTWGLGFLLLSSYTTMASTIFYQRLKGQVQQAAYSQPEVPAASPPEPM